MKAVDKIELKEYEYLTTPMELDLLSIFKIVEEYFLSKNLEGLTVEDITKEINALFEDSNE